jgi:hypothetical protein
MLLVFFAAREGVLHSAEVPESLPGKAAYSCLSLGRAYRSEKTWRTWLAFVPDAESLAGD